MISSENISAYVVHFGIVCTLVSSSFPTKINFVIIESLYRDALHQLSKFIVYKNLSIVGFVVVTI